MNPVQFLYGNGQESPPKANKFHLRKVDLGVPFTSITHLHIKRLKPKFNKAIQKIRFERNMTHLHFPPTVSQAPWPEGEGTTINDNFWK